MFKEINVTLGERIRKCRKAQGYTREYFSELVSITPRFLASIENGDAGVSISNLKNMALTLNVSTDYLLGIDNPQEDDLMKRLITAKLDNIEEDSLPYINTILDCIINIAK